MSWDEEEEDYLFMTPPRAAGMSTSHSSVSSKIRSTVSPPSKPLISQFSAECFIRLAMSMPLEFLTATVTSLMSMIVFYENYDRDGNENEELL